MIDAASNCSFEGRKPLEVIPTEPKCGCLVDLYRALGNKLAHFVELFLTSTFCLIDSWEIQMKFIGISNIEEMGVLCNMALKIYGECHRFSSWV